LTSSVADFHPALVYCLNCLHCAWFSSASVVWNSLPRSVSLKSPIADSI